MTVLAGTLIIVLFFSTVPDELDVIFYLYVALWCGASGECCFEWWKTW